MMAVPRRILVAGIPVLCAVLLAGACSGPGASGGEERAAAAGDSTAATDSTVEPSAPAPPPRTAKVRGAVLTCTDEGEAVTCEIRIEEVLAYGMNTPPMAAGSRTVAVRPVVLRDRGVDALVAAGTQTLTLQHAGDRPQLGGSDGDRRSPAWALTAVANEDTSDDP